MLRQAYAGDRLALAVRQLMFKCANVTMFLKLLRHPQYWCYNVAAIATPSPRALRAKQFSALLINNETVVSELF